ncbi:hypothetical protein [Candidatus Chlamydia corallus]|uniref:hypothetical protein n=1 Tax=Candidatus Chlamydia corallus TaxID=2038470 RepID=UPI000C2FC587|nr:hypothetical protein [Candidatus Chlamydia corallus]
MVKCCPLPHQCKEPPSPPLQKSRSLTIATLCLTILALFLAIGVCVIIPLTGLLPNTLLIIGLCFLGIIVLATGISLLCEIQWFKSPPKIKEKLKPILPTETPSLSPWLLNVLKSEIQPAQSSSIKLKKEMFFSSFERWREVFLKDPDFLIKSALTNWKISESEESQRYILSHIHMDPRILITPDSLEKLYEGLSKKHTNNLGIASQVSFTDLDNKIQYADNLIQTAINEITYYFPVVNNAAILKAEQDNVCNQLYLVFKLFFTHYHNLFSTALEENQVLLINSLTTGSENPIARKIEILALLCVFEQLNYSEDEYIIEPGDYFSRFVHKKSYTAPKTRSFGLLQSYQESFGLPQSQEEMSFASNNIRNVLTHSIILSSPFFYQLIAEFDIGRTNPNDSD